MKIKKVSEMGGIHRDVFVEYFISIGGKHIKDGTYIGDKWEVYINQEEFYYLGNIKIPSVKIALNIEEDIFDEMIYKFRLKFLSAGG